MPSRGETVESYIHFAKKVFGFLWLIPWWWPRRSRSGSLRRSVVGSIDTPRSAAWGGQCDCSMSYCARVALGAACRRNRVRGPHGGSIFPPRGSSARGTWSPFPPSHLGIPI